MINGSSIPKGAHRIDQQFLDRCSPRAISGAPLSPEELLSFFEEARWAPSSAHLQPWRMLFARRETPSDRRALEQTVCGGAWALPR